MSTENPDKDTDFIYKLVDGEGIGGNTHLAIKDNERITLKSFDYEITTTSTIRIRCQDKEGASFERPFPIVILDEVEVITSRT